MSRAVGGEKILFGGSGRLGKEFLRLYPRYRAPGHRDVDITDAARVREYLHDIGACCVIHAAAVVGAGETESDPDGAYRVNVLGTEAVARACGEIGARLVYVGSAAVFDGQKGMYAEQDIPRPAYFYGWLKLMGEQAVRMTHNWAIMRTDFFTPGAFKYRHVYTDHYCSKLPVSMTARALEAILRSDYRGVIHVGGPRDTLFNIIRSYDPSVEGITVSGSDMPDFPRDLSLNTTLFRSRFPGILP